MSPTNGGTSLANRRQTPSFVKDLSDLTRPIQPRLDEVRSLITERVFREEDFGELLLATGNNGKWDLPEWLAKIIRADDPRATPSLPHEMAKHLTSRSGKLFRATLVIYTVEALSPEETRGPKLAAAMELIHLATLVHDDVIDRADIRRGMASLPSLYDNGPTVLMGDHLFARAFELIAECENMGIILSSCRATSAMCRGEIEQLQWIDREEIPEEVYFDLIRKKTAALMGCCTESAALLSGRDPVEAKEWYRLGISLGLVFQMTDDLLDFVADEAVLGKRVGSDLSEGKYTLPLILLRDHLDEGAAGLKALLSGIKAPQEIPILLEEKGILDSVRQRIEDVAESCHAQLDRFAAVSPRPESFEPIHHLIDFLISRNH